MASSTTVKGQVKGLLKGLRYISQIFDEQDEEKEIQIGFPTDVKHLAHIGCEDANANAPSWMTEYNETSEPSSGAVVNSTKKMPEDNGDNNNNSKGDGKKVHVRKPRPRSRETQSSTTSPTREISSEGTKQHTRRHHSTESSRRQHHHHHHSSEDEKPPTTKHSHRRKSKTTTSEEKDGSTRRPSRTRGTSKGESLTDASFADLTIREHES